MFAKYAARTDYLKAGHTPEKFLGGFPSVSRAQATACLQMATELALVEDEHARAAFDDNAGWRLGRPIDPMHEVVTVTERGWSGMKNGDLLSMAEQELTPS